MYIIGSYKMIILQFSVIQYIDLVVIHQKATNMLLGTIEENDILVDEKLLVVL